MRPLTLPACLQHAIRNGETNIVFIKSSTEEDSLPYKILYEEALKCLGFLQQSGIHAGDELILQIEDNRSFLIFFWACLLGKIIAVPLSTGITDDHRNKLYKVWNTLSHPFLATDDKQLNQIEKYAQKEGLGGWKDELRARMINPETALAALQAGSELSCTLEDIAYIQFSSGSTGDPKGVVLTHRNLYYNTSDINSRSRVGSNDLALSWMPLTHDMGLICFHLACVMAGITHYIMPTPLFIRRPLLWLDKAAAHRVTQLYSPNFGYEYLMNALENHAAPAWDLSSVRIIFNGAEPISIHTCNRFLHKTNQYGMQPQVLHPGYGLAEASVAVALPDPGDPLVTYSLHRDHIAIGEEIQQLAFGDEHAVYFVENGYPIANCQVRVCDDSGNTLGEQRIGHLQIKGENVTAGYYRNPAATKELLTPDGWLKTGDLGFLCNGRLVITGRVKNLIIVNGQNYYPQDIERQLTDIPGLEAGKVAAAGTARISGTAKQEELLVFVLFKASPQAFLPLASTIRSRLAEKPGLLPDKVIPVNKIPKTTSGKVQYFQLVQQYLRGDFDGLLQEIARLQHEERKTYEGTPDLQTKIAAILSELTGTQVDMRASPLELGMNSLQMMMLVNRLQQSGIRLDLTELFSLSALSELASRATVSIPATKKAPGRELREYPLSHAQHRMWVLCEMQGMWSSFHLSAAAKISGAVNIAALEKTVAWMVNAHAALRTALRYNDGVPVQQVLDSDSICITHINARPEEMAGIAENEAGRAFDKGKPLFRTLIAHLGAEEYLLQFTFHHLIFDGWSFGIFMREFNSCYDLFSRGMEVKTPERFAYSDFVDSEQILLDNGAFEQSRQYWENEISEATPEPGLLRQFKYSGEDRHMGSCEIFTLPPELKTALEKFSLNESVTPFMTLFSLLSLLYYKLTGQQDMILGTEAAGRTSPEWEPVIGCFLNTLPIRIMLDSSATFRDLLSQVKRKLLDAYQHQQYPVDLALHASNRNINTQLFDVLMLYQNFEHTLDMHELGAMAAEPLVLPEHGSIVDLQLEFRATKDAIQLHIRYNTDYYDKIFVTQLFTRYCRILEQAMDAPEQQIANYSLLSAEEQHTVLHRFNPSLGPHPFEAITAIIEADKEKKADRIAIICDERSITYRDLQLSVDSVAASLQHICKCSPDCRIAVMMERSERMIIAILAILKAGAAYVPVETTYPAERVQFILEDSGVEWVITDTDIPPAGVVPVIDWDTLVHTGVDVPATPADIQEHHLAYVLYTSGTTGQPKGVMIEHGSLSDYVRTFTTFYSINKNDIVIQQSALAFDTHVEEIFPTLCSGATLVLLPGGGADISAMVETIQKERASVLSTTPLVIQALNARPAALGSLRLLISGGDELKAGYISHLLGKTVIYNSYGPTESTVCAAYQEIKSLQDTTLIGKPVGNRQIFLLDRDNRLLPPGLAGEICIAGAGLARGYQNLEKETAARFIYPGGAISGRIYKTGDIGRWDSDGRIMFLGRRDDQVKVRGFRIELPEIEKALSAHPGVKAIAARTWENGEEKQLAVYYVSSPQLPVEELQDFAVNRLPYYMVPAFFIPIDSMPQNVNGKIDRNRLPRPASAEWCGEEWPATPAEVEMAQIWSQVLGTEKIHLDTHFFRAGGNSIRAAQVTARLKERGWEPLRLGDFFLYPALRKLSLQLRKAKRGSMPVMVEKTAYPLTYAQRRLWYLHQLGRQRSALNLCWAYRISGSLQVDAFRQALEMLVHRHDSLRTIIKDTDGVPAMTICDSTTFTGWFEWIEIDREEAVNDLIQQERNRLFDLLTGPLLHITLVKDRKDEQFIFLMSIHHMIIDGWSMQVFIRDLKALYNACVEERAPVLPPVTLRFHDYAWHQSLLQEDAQMAAHRDFWRQTLQHPALPLTFPAIPEQEAGSIPSTNRHVVTFAPEWIKALEQLSEEENASLFMGLVTLLNALFYKYTGQEDILIGTDTANRQYPALENAMGYFLNELVIRCTFSSALTFRDLVQLVKANMLQAFAHQEYPYDKDTLAPGQTVSGRHLFDVLVLFQQFGRNEQMDALSGDVMMQPLDIPLKDIMLDLQLEFFQPGPEQLLLEVRYNTSVFSERLIKQLFHHFELFSSRLMKEPDRALCEQELLSGQEIAGWLEDRNNTGRNNGPFIPVSTLIAQQAAITPLAPAICCGTDQLTYAALNERANQLAYQLLQQGAAPGKRTGVLMSRSIWMPVTLLAILKAGNTYVPLDPEYPAERLQFISADSKIDCIITEPDICRLQGEWLQQQHCLLPGEATLQQPIHDPVIIIEKNLTAYIIYTSGSTGVPKGVMISHASLADYVRTFSDFFEVSHEDRVIQQSSISFDTLVEELFPVLVAGGTLYIAPAGGRDAEMLSAIIVRHQITILSTTPLVAGALNRMTTDVSSLRVLISGGDVLFPSQIDRLLSQVRIYNTYGPSESTVCATYHKVSGENDCTQLGKAIANREVYLLDKDMKLVADGVAGEICLGGNGLATGYVGLPEEEADRFVKNPYNNERLYKTGDLGYMLPTGAIQFVGRKDQQLKIRGYRIEPGEIENVCAKLHGIATVAVTAVDAWGATPALALYYSTYDKKPLEGLYEQLAAILPFYMLPSHIIHLLYFPLTATGKIDRRALPAPDSTAARAVVPFNNHTEIVLAKIWKEVLGTALVDRNNHFFLSGGNSVAATRLLNAVRKHFSRDVQLKDIFTKPVLHQFANVVQESPAISIDSVAILEEQDVYTASAAQRRMWILHQLDTGKTAYNISISNRLYQHIDTVSLEHALRIMIARHESLRTIFLEKEGRLLQQVLPASLTPFQLQVIAGSEEQLNTIAAAAAAKTFELNRWPLFAVTLVETGAQQATVMFTFHHIIADGASINILMDECWRIYQALRENMEPALPALDFQYKDYSAFQQQLLSGHKLDLQKKYWLTVFEKDIPVLEIPGKNNYPATRSFRGHTHTILLEKAIVEGLKAMCLQQESTLYISLLTTVVAFLYRYTGQHDLVIGIPVTGRTIDGAEKQVGLFVNTLALRIGVAADESFSTLFSSVHKAAINAYDNQDYPFDLLVDSLQLNRDISRSPLFDVMAVMLENGSTLTRAVDYAPIHANISKFDINFDFEEMQEGLAVRIQLNADIFSVEEGASLTGYYRELLQACVYDSNRRLAAICYLPEEEQLAQLAYNPVPVTLPDKSILQLFEEQVLRRPDETALIFQQDRLSFADFNTRVNQLAHYLKEEYHIAPGDLVGIMLPRSTQLIIAIWAVMKAGAVYVPIDPAYPRERKEWMAADSGIRLLLADPAFAEGQWPCPVSYPGSLDLHTFSANDLQWCPGQDSAAYVIYTSGTTGRPKGVMIGHDALKNLVMWLGGLIYENHITPLRCLLTASINFDASVQQLFAPLVFGHTLVVIDEQTRKNLPLYAGILRDEQIQVTDLTPSFLSTLLTELEQTPPPPLLYVLCGGEPLDAMLVRRFDSYFDAARLINVYGVTEATVDNTWEWAGADRSRKTIGKPLMNTRVYLLDNQLQMVPLGMPGQICLAGAGVGMHYLNTPELSNRKFVNTTIAGIEERIYLTGDAGKWLPDGTIEFIGRIDRQIKLRGYRIEPGEIEGAMLSHPDVQQAYVMQREDNLVAYYQGKNSLRPADLEALLKQHLPAHMIPVHWVPLTAFPVTHSGKINESALPLPVQSPVAEPHEAAGALLQQIAAIWKEVLNKPAIGIFDNFFLSGGHSLSAMLLASRLSKELDRDFRLQDIFVNQTIHEQAALARSQNSMKGSAPGVFEEQDHYPLSHAQYRLWVIDQKGGGIAYHMPSRYRLKGALNIAALEAAFSALLMRHEILRTNFKLINGEVRQFVNHNRPFRMIHPDQPDDMSVAMDLETDALIKAALLRVAPDEYLLRFVMHHIISDGWSAGIIEHDLISLYNYYAAPGNEALAPKNRQYKDFVLDQAIWLQTNDAREHARYWQEELHAMQSTSAIPYDYTPTEEEWTGSTLDFELDAVAANDIIDLAGRQGCTVHSCLITAVYLTLYSFTRSAELLINVPVAGRNKEDMHDQIGFYVNTLPLFFHLDEQQSCTALLSAVHRKIQTALCFQHYPPELSESYAPLTEDLLRHVLFVFNDTPARERSVSPVAITIEEERMTDTGTKYDLTIVCNKQANKITGYIKYRSSRYSTVRIERLKERLLLVCKDLAAGQWQTAAGIVGLTSTLSNGADMEIDIPLNL
ncbi:non-ribosomal peptide synthetase [Chitinophaga qingshengii]|uniref:Amino acid adenylation domain-containing protein n=1 Tax=Chitinophaga qingshengii TaxID=1569794 RepID=A0ABR7TZ23_9BACT|nr:non-ribosomal peptide synthetase [Chitinophaga qingshengii]MBC9934524.1 amino acid adenylation domain-containing protein [Chitinophaga qingshengii]